MDRKPRARAGHRSRFDRAPGKVSRRVPTKHIPPELIAEAKRLYLHTNVPTGDICALLGIGTNTFHKRLKAWGWPSRSRRIPKDEPRAAAEIGLPAVPPEGRSAPAGPPADRERLVARLYRLVEQQLDQAEHARSGSGLPVAAERAEQARELAALARTLSATGRLRAVTDNPSDDEPDEPAFRSMEELGRAISAHLDAIELERARKSPGADEGG